MKTIFEQFRSVLYHGYGIPVVVSVLIHAGMLGLLLVSWTRAPETKQAPPLHIKASLVKAPEPKPTVPKVDNSARIEAEKARKARQVEQARKKAEALARKKEVERKKQIALKKKQDAEAKAKRVAELKKKEQERQKQLAAQKKQAQEALMKKLAEEQRAREQAQQETEQAAKDAQEVSYYSSLLQNRMIYNWNRPPSARNDMVTIVQVHLSPFGDLQGFKIIQGSGNEAFDRSVVQAIKLGTPFEELKQLDRRIFEKYFRRFTFKFSPGDLVR